MPNNKDDRSDEQKRFDEFFKEHPEAEKELSAAVDELAKKGPFAAEGTIKTIQNILEQLEAVSERFGEILKDYDLPQLEWRSQYINALAPFVKDELAARNMTFEDLYKREDLWDEILQIATRKYEEATSDIDNQQSRRPKDILLPVDKLNAQIIFADWLDNERQLDNQVGMFPVKMEPDGSAPLTLYYVINYPADLAQSEKKLTPFDKRIYNATYWLQQTNGRDMTFTQIAKASGFSNPNGKQLDRIKDSVNKMRLTGIEWNNMEEATAHKRSDDKYIVYKGYLYPVEVIEERKAFNGKITDAFVRTLKPLPLLEFAKERNQVAVVPASIIQSNLRLTDLNIALQDYIIKRIEQDRSARKRSNKAKASADDCRRVKIIYTTLYDNTGANTRQKKRTIIDNLYIYLDELKAKKYIKAFEEETTKSTGAVGVVIYY